VSCLFGTAASGAEGAVHKLLRPTVLVPSELPFTVPLKQCSGLKMSSKACTRPLGVKEVVDKSVEIILSELPLETADGGSYRCPPLVFSRLSRGGKSTVLNELFKELQSRALNCIVLSFNRIAGFRSRIGESQRGAILRMIAAQLVTPSSPERMVDIECDEIALDRYIGEDPFVLLIDELDDLAHDPIDRDANQLLRAMFLDKKNRYLVFTTRIPLTVDDGFLHARGCRVVPMPVETDLRMVWTMDGCYHNVTSAEVALYGGIPSLIYSVKHLNEMKPQERFNSCVFTSFNSDALLGELLTELVDGRRVAMHRSLRCFDAFSSAPESSLIQWPLCYISCLLSRCPQTEIRRELIGCIASLEALCQTLESGKDWEVIVQFALILRCCYHEGGYPFHQMEEYVPPGCLPDVTVFKPFARDSAGAHAEIKQHCAGFMGPTLVVVIPRYAKFPLFDAFVAFHNPGKDLYVLGIQMKLGRAVPKARGNSFQWVSRGYLVRGLPAEASYETDFWHCLNSAELNQLLGVSLSALQPCQWPQVPNLDDFDEPL
jgi:hypothetical protein